jgi:hypothetical protein
MLQNITVTARFDNPLNTKAARIVLRKKQKLSNVSWRKLNRLQCNMHENQPLYYLNVHG